MRGPDVLADPKATYAADVWGSLLQNPNGRFKNAVMESVPLLYDKDYLSAYYYTQRDGGQISFGASFFVDPTEISLPEQSLGYFREVIRGQEVAAMARG